MHTLISLKKMDIFERALMEYLCAHYHDSVTENSVGQTGPVIYRNPSRVLTTNDTDHNNYYINADHHLQVAFYLLEHDIIDAANAISLMHADVDSPLNESIVPFDGMELVNILAEDPGMTASQLFEELNNELLSGPEWPPIYDSSEYRETVYRLIDQTLCLTSMEWHISCEAEQYSPTEIVSLEQPLTFIEQQPEAPINPRASSENFDIDYDCRHIVFLTNPVRGGGFSCIN